MELPSDKEVVPRPVEAKLGNDIMIYHEIPVLVLAQGRKVNRTISLPSPYLCNPRTTLQLWLAALGRGCSLHGLCNAVLELLGEELVRD